tara:strand:+ start:939 stop:1112 length:174 start_codon:yes stop_codon:yes gene_type:complete
MDISSSEFKSFVQEVRENFEDVSYELAEVTEQLNQINSSVIILMTQLGTAAVEVSNE